MATIASHPDTGGVKTGRSLWLVDQEFQTNSCAPGLTGTSCFRKQDGEWLNKIPDVKL